MILATRGSALAMAQAAIVKKKLEDAGEQVTILPEQKERGQFLKELMRQLLEEAEAIRGSEPRKSAYREQELRDMAKRFQKRREQP